MNFAALTIFVFGGVLVAAEDCFKYSQECASHPGHKLQEFVERCGFGKDKCSRNSDAMKCFLNIPPEPIEKGEIIDYEAFKGVVEEFAENEDIVNKITEGIKECDEKKEEKYMCIIERIQDACDSDSYFGKQNC